MEPERHLAGFGKRAGENEDGTYNMDHLIRVEA